MLLRFKEETPEKIAGFVKAAQASITQLDVSPQVDLDWSCYACKRRQLPWFSLATLALSQSGVKIFIHGTEGHTAGRVYAEKTSTSLGLHVENSLPEASEILKISNVFYFPLKHFSTALSELIGLKSVLSLRSPIHTIARMLNPFSAPYVLQGIFHPRFNFVHQKAATLIGQPHLAVFRAKEAK